MMECQECWLDTCEFAELDNYNIVKNDTETFKKFQQI